MSATHHAPKRVPHGSLDDKVVLEALQEEREYSLSELETYLACPYRWFYERAVSPTGTDVEFGVRERGSLAHELLAAFYREWAAEGRGRVCTANMDEALCSFDKQAAAMLEEVTGSRLKGLAEELTAARAVTWARSIVEDDATFLLGLEPAHHEFRFGEASERPVSFAGVALKGSIDRIDIGPSGIVVTDYKSSGSLSGAGSFAAKGVLQAPAYLAIASELLGAPALAGVYRSMKTLEIRGLWRASALEGGPRWKNADGVDDIEFTSHMEAAANRLRGAVRGIRSGNIAAIPGVGGACEFCGLRGACGGAGS